MPSTNEAVNQIRNEYKRVTFEHWYRDDFLSLPWWFLLAATILPWVIWWRWLRVPTRTPELLLCVFAWTIIAMFCDVWGAYLLLWGYPDKLMPTVPPFLPADMSVIPLSFTCAYQFTASWRTYLLAVLALSACFSYIIEPLFIHFGMFEIHDWRHTYSLLGFILAAILMRYSMLRWHAVAGMRPVDA
ncbi:CBO0543 family protein [Paenibacillus aurantiacus]|uniref:CBO0543 family protein n=1 Tax=Paenibacillus aurantiacus TaxID=1936118 RepID=A0ABV5KYI1_9BACL